MVSTFVFTVLYLLICFVIAIPIGWLIWRRQIKKLKKKFQEDMKGGKDGEKNNQEENRREISRGSKGERDVADNNSPKGRRRVQILPTQQPTSNKRKPKKDWPSFD